LRECIIIGHKGAAGHAPENTLLSFAAAYELGAAMVELDVHETLDGHLVCIHDESVDRTTNGTGQVREMTLDQIRRLDAGRGEKIPLLSEVLDFVRGKLQVNIEIKTLGLESRLLELISSRNMFETVLVSSFKHGTILKLKELNPNIKTAALVKSVTPDLISSIVKLGPDAINPLYTIAHREFIEAAHEKGLKVYPWTVNEALAMSRLVRDGADGIITDYPDIALKVVRKYIC
jgi:glycerophosphoryl diester phosphodiesterase